METDLPGGTSGTGLAGGAWAGQRDVTPSAGTACASSPRRRGAGSGAVARVEQRVDDVHDLPPRAARLAADALERLAVAQRVSLHEDALGPFDSRPALEGVQEPGELVVALE